MLLHNRIDQLDAHGLRIFPGHAGYLFIVISVMQRQDDAVDRMRDRTDPVLRLLPAEIQYGKLVHIPPVSKGTGTVPDGSTPFLCQLLIAVHAGRRGIYIILFRRPPCIQYIPQIQIHDLNEFRAVIDRLPAAVCFCSNFRRCISCRKHKTQTDHEQKNSCYPSL